MGHSALFQTNSKMSFWLRWFRILFSSYEIIIWMNNVSSFVQRLQLNWCLTLAEFQGLRKMSSLGKMFEMKNVNNEESVCDVAYILGSFDRRGIIVISLRAGIKSIKFHFHISISIIDDISVYLEVSVRTPMHMMVSYHMLCEDVFTIGLRNLRMAVSQFQPIDR